MNKSATDFIDTVLAQIKYKKVHNTIAEELNSHINELAEDYMTEGIKEEEAFCKAVSQMGNPTEIGRRLHKTHKPKPEWSIMLLLGAIVGYGLYIISIYSSVYLDSESFYNQVFFAAVGICVLVFCYFFDYTRLERYSLPVYFLTCVLLLLSIFFGINRIGGAYILILGFRFTLSLMTIPILLVCYAGLIKKWCDGDIKNMLKLISASVLPLFLILLEPSFLNMLITGTGIFAMLTFSIYSSNYKGKKRITLLIIYGSMCVAIVLLISCLFGSPYIFIERLTAFVNPQIDPQGFGYTNIVLDKILSSSKLIGNSTSLDTYGSGNSPYHLPCSSTEFIFTFVVGQLGWIFGLLLITLLCLSIFRLFAASSKITHEYGKYLSVGICCVFSIQIILNVLMNFGLCPILGVSLPFFSYGGASYLLNMTLLGLFLGIYRRKDILNPKSKVD